MSKKLWDKVAKRLKMPWNYTGTFVNPDLAPSLMNPEYRFPSPASQPAPETKDRFPDENEEILANSYYFDNPTRYYVEPQIITMKFKSGKFVEMDVKELEEGSPDAPFQDLNMKKVNMEKAFAPWRDRVGENNILPTDNPLSIHGLSFRMAEIPIEDWDEYFEPEDLKLPEGPGLRNPYETESYEDYIERMNAQMEEEEKMSENKD